MKDMLKLALAPTSVPAHHRKGPRGARNQKARFSAEQITEIRRRYWVDGETPREIGRAHDATSSTIINILARRSWNYLPRAEYERLATKGWETAHLLALEYRRRYAETKPR